MPTAAEKIAGQAEDLTKNLEKLSKDLEKNIAGAQKDIDAPKLKDLRTLKGKWDELSSKSIKLQFEWKKNKDGKDEKDYAAFTKFVNSQVVAGRNLEARIDKLEEQVSSDGDDAANAQKALAQAEDYYKDEVAARLQQAEEAVINMQHALVREFPKGAAAAYRIAMNALPKEIRESLTPAGFKKTLQDFAQKNKVKLADLENDAVVKGRITNNALVRQRLQNSFKALEKKYDVLEKALEHQHAEMLELEQEKEKQAASTDPRASKEYQTNLNNLLKSYKEALKEHQKTVAGFRDTADEMSKYINLIARADETEELVSLADKAVSAADALFTGERKFQKEVGDKFAPNAMKSKFAKHNINPGDIKKFFEPLQKKAKELGDGAEDAQKTTKTKLESILASLKEHSAALAKKTVPDGEASDKARDVASLAKAIRSVQTTISAA